jgi:hypothetical protein
MESRLEEFRSEIAGGKTRSDVIASMQRRSRELFGVSLGDAKELVVSHPAYSDAAAASAPLHDETIRVLEDFEKDR